MTVNEKAKEYFGTTKSFRIAGYILTDGTPLDFSGAHWLRDEDPEYVADWRRKNDIRQADHEDIYEVLGRSGDNRKYFMDMGNIRISPEAPGINISAKAEPTTAQYGIIMDFVETVLKDPYYDCSRFYVDIEDKYPDKLFYEDTLNPRRVVNDIRNYFRKEK